MKQLFSLYLSKNRLLALLVVTLFLAPTPVMATGSHDACATKYPIVLAHGMGASASILGIMDYWGDLDAAMEDEGADVYITSVNGMDSTRNKAEDFKIQFLQIKAISGAAKLNIIAHSHGALYTRDAISNLGLSPYVASQTSIAGVNRGSAIADVILGIVPNDLEWLVGDTVDFVYAYLFGDTNPNTLDNAYDLARPYVNNTFNPNTPDMSGVYYQSWAAKIKMMAVNARNWYFLATWLILLDQEGANDGLVSVESAKWGNFRGVEDAAFYSAGCDHLNIIGMPFGITPGFDEEEFFVELAADLKSRGY